MAGDGISVVTQSNGSVLVSADAPNDNIVATITGSTFSGPVNAQYGLTGSLLEVMAGVPYITSLGPSTKISTTPMGQIVISTNDDLFLSHVIPSSS